MAMGSINGKSIATDENNGVDRQQELERDGIRREVKALVKQVAESYRALENLMEQNPWLTEEMDGQDRERKRAFDDKLRQGLSRANDAPRCRWVKQDGTSCGSPQMRKHIYCYAHRQMMEARALALRLPAIEDANGIQLALMRVQKALIDDQISMKKAGLLLYSLQLGMTNVGKTTFGRAPDDEMVADTVEEQDAIREELGVEAPKPIFTRDMPGLREYQKIGPSGHLNIGPSEDQHQNRFTAENAEVAENAEETGVSAHRMGPIAAQEMGQTHAKMG